MKKISIGILSSAVLLWGVYGAAVAMPLGFSLSHSTGSVFKGGETLVITFAEDNMQYDDVVFSVDFTIGVYDPNVYGYNYGAWEASQVDKITWTESLDGSELQTGIFKDFSEKAKFYPGNITTSAVNYDDGLLSLSLVSEISKSNETWRFDSVSVTGDPVPNPIPGTVVLFGSGLVGLVCIKRRLR